MFHFLRKKPTLLDLIPKQFVDIHSHILPGIDDGVKNIEESLKLIRRIEQLGFQKIIATPHTIAGVWDNTSESIKKSFDNLLKADRSNKNRISFASEYLIDSSFKDKIKSKEILCLKESFVLIELSYFQAPIDLYEILFELQLAGYTPVLAHPERYSYFHSDIKKFLKLKKAGCLFQLNLMSTVGYYGKHCLRVADKLLEQDLIDFVGSDIHHQGHIEVFQNKTKVKEIDKLQISIESNNFFSN